MRKKGNKRIRKISLFGVIATVTTLAMCTVSQASLSNVSGVGNRNTIIGGSGSIGNVSGVGNRNTIIGGGCSIGNVSGVGNKNTIYCNTMAEAQSVASQISNVSGVGNKNTIICGNQEVYNYLKDNISISNVSGVGNRNVIVLASATVQQTVEVVTPTPTPQPVTPQPEGSVPSGETPVTQQPEVSVPSGETPVTQQPEVKKPEEKTPTDKDKTDLDNVPKTGDTSNITLVVGLMAASLVVMITLIIVRKKNKHRV